MTAAMKTLLVACAVAAASGLTADQDPCAGCNEQLAQAYQLCARDFGNPCAERNDQGLVSSGPGTKKDMSCCMKKEKHDRCLECKSMDCQYKTCNVNKMYYAERTVVQEAKASTKEAYKKHDAAAMKAAGWGDF